MGGTIMKHERIGQQHLERKAILHVRQSSAHQVLHNRESRALQYAMPERLADFGGSRIEAVNVEAVGLLAQIATDDIIA